MSKLGITEKLKNFKKWCPQPTDNRNTKQKTYSKQIFAILTATLIVGISFSFISPQFNVSPTLPNVPLIIDQPGNSSQSSVPSTTFPAIKEETSLISEKEAIKIAMPFFNQYAMANNSTIAIVDTVFYKLNESVPVWDVIGACRGTPSENNASSWILNYKVTVFAESGQICDVQVYR